MKERNGTIFTWIIGILVVIAMAVNGYMVKRVDSVQAMMTEKYVTREAWNYELSRIGVTLRRMDDKLDRLMERGYWKGN